MTIESPKQTWCLLGLALAISIVIAVPSELVIYPTFSPGTYWLQNFCAVIVAKLNLGGMVQAILVPLFVFLLPGRGSIFQKKIAPRNARCHYNPISFIAIAWLCAAVFFVAWWYGMQHYAGVRGECADLFDATLEVRPYRIDFLSDSYRYFFYRSVFSGFWTGIAAGGLRVEAARAAEGDSANSEVRQLQSFRWFCLLSWPVQFCLWEFLPSRAHQTSQEWVTTVVVLFVLLSASSLWVLAFVRPLWKRRPQTCLRAVIMAFVVGFLIYVVTALSFFFVPIYAGLLLLWPLMTFNLCTLPWALAVGTWRWRALQREKRSALLAQTSH